MAYSSTAEFHHGSTNITLFAIVKLRPTPPALSEISKILLDFSEPNYSKTIFLSLWESDPSSLYSIDDNKNINLPNILYDLVLNQFQLV